MSQTIELAGKKMDELLCEAASRQARLTLDYRSQNGWTTTKAFLLGFDRGSGDLIVAHPFTPECMQPEVVEGQVMGASFRRAHRKCAFETAMVGRCRYSAGRADEVPAWRLERPERMTELQRRLYYRTPVPQGLDLPVQVRLWEGPAEGGRNDRPCRGRMADLSAGGVSLLLKEKDNPHWAPQTPVICSFVAAPGEARLELCGHVRYLYELPETDVRMGVQFVGLESSKEARGALEQILDLTESFQQIERKQVAVAR